MKTYSEIVEFIAQDLYRKYQSGHLNISQYNLDLVTFIYGFAGGIVQRDINAVVNMKIRKNETGTKIS